MNPNLDDTEKSGNSLKIRKFSNAHNLASNYRIEVVFFFKLSEIESGTR